MSGNGSIRLMLCDDHRIILDGLQGLLGNTPDLEVVGTATNGAEVLELLEHIAADVLLMDINMPVMDGFQALERLKKQGASVKVIMLTMHDEAGVAQQAIEKGAKGYVVKDSGKDELLLAIRQVHSGQRHFSSTVTEALLKGNTADARRTGPLAGLSERELEVLSGIAEGLTNKELGQRLFISPRTVDTHRTNLMKEMKVHNVAGLVRIAIQAGLVH